MSSYSDSFNRPIQINMTNNISDSSGLETIPESPASNKVIVLPGHYRNSTGTKTIQFQGGVSPIFQPIVAYSRIDLLCLDDSGMFVIIQGVENINPQPQPYPLNKLTIAKIKITEKQNVIIDNDDIEDIRDILGPSSFIINGGTFY